MLQPITVSFQSRCASFDSPFGVFTSNVFNGLVIKIFTLAIFPHALFCPRRYALNHQTETYPHIPHLASFHRSGVVILMLVAKLFELRPTISNVTLSPFFGLVLPIKSLALKKVLLAIAGDKSVSEPLAKRPHDT
jgi:hypothetical protein